MPPSDFDNEPGADDRDQEPEDEAPEEAEGGHISFVQRLQRQYGKDVDPGISLQDDDDESSASSARSPSSASSRGLLQKLSGQLPSAGRYKVSKKIARGGMGAILRVWDDDLRRNLAMKVMLARGSKGDDTPASEVDEEQLGRFLEEAQITGQLDHPGVVPVHDLGIDDKGRCYFTMRLVRGRELKEILDLTRAGKEGWTTTKTLGLILKVCEAMAFAHSKGVVHRDLKPANIMVGRFGEVYVMDWGLARVLGRRDSHDIRLKPHPKDASAMSLVRTVRRDDADLNPDSPLVTMDGDVVGTPSYMALEQAQGKLDQIGPRSDVYALGAVLYSMLTGRAPYVKEGERVSPHTVLNRVLQGPPQPVSELATNAPEELTAICEKAMARESADRYGSMLEVADDVQAFLEDRVVGAYEGGAVAEMRKWVTRNRGIAGAVAALVILSIASAFGFAYQKNKRVLALDLEQQQTQKAREQAEDNLIVAQEKEEEAQRNLQKAMHLKEQADTSAAAARESELLSRRSSYAANVSGADFSLRLNDVVEARWRLRESDPQLRGWEWAHLDLRANPSLYDLGSAGVQIDAVALSPDAKRVFTYTRHGRLRIRDVETGQVLPPDDIFNPVDLGAFAPMRMDVTRDGLRAVVAGRGATIRLYDLRTGRTIYELPQEGIGHESRAGAIAFRPDGSMIASGADDGTVILWDAELGTLEQRLAGHSSSVTDLSWSADGRLLAGSSSDGTVRIWSADGEEEQLIRGHSAAIQGIVWGGEADKLYTVATDGLVNEWSVSSGRLTMSFSGHEGAVRAIDIDPAGRRLVTASADRTVRIWDIATGGHEILRGHGDSVQEVRFGPAGRLIVSGGEDGSIKVWDARGDLSVTVLDHPKGPVNAVAFHPNGRLAVTGGGDGRLIAWDTYSGEPLQALEGHTAMIDAVVYSSDGRTILTGSHDKTARLWDALTGRELMIFRGHGRWISGVAMTPDGTRVLTASADRTVRIWDPSTGEMLTELGGHPRAIEALAIHPDGSRFATSARRILVWNMGEDEPFAQWTMPRAKALALAFDPLADRLVSTGQDRVTTIWNLETQKAELSLKDHDGAVRALAFDPKGERFVTAAADGTLRVRDARTGGTLLVLRGHDDDVMSVAFSADGSRILSGSEDGTARVWETGLAEQRRAAWLAATELRERAEPVVEEFFARHTHMTDVLRALERDGQLDPDVRRASLRFARLQGDDADYLDAINRREVASPGLEPETYSRALDRAKVALEMAGDDPHLWCTLGMAFFRTGDYADAINHFRRASGLSEAARRSGDAAVALPERAELSRLLYLAMSQHGDDNHDAALRFLGTARAMMEGNPELASHRPLVSLFEEAEDYLGLSGGTPAESGS